jgi:hypothetical protein
MKFAYADPPYIGQAKKHYSKEKLCAEVDHAALIADLMNFDGWALSASSVSLWTLARLQNADGPWSIPEDARVGSWVKPFASFKPGVNPAYAWEPVIFYGGRKRGRDLPTVRDWVSANITMQKGLSGAKPLEFCYWIFEIMGAQLGDEFHDLYPGTGIVTHAWENFNKNMSTRNLPMFEATS